MQGWNPSHEDQSFKVTQRLKNARNLKSQATKRNNYNMKEKPGLVIGE
jgi:hypothetical protein